MRLCVCLPPRVYFRLLLSFLPATPPSLFPPYGANGSLEAIFLMFCRLGVALRVLQDLKTVKWCFFSTFLCFVDTREAEEEDLFDQAPATPYLHTQVYRRLALAAVGGVGRGSRRCSRPDYLSA